MARTKEFDADSTLVRALACFKRHGFAGSSMSVLTDAMGIGRASLYATYGDKRALYRAALENYAEATVRFVEQRLDESADPLAAIRSLLREVATKAGDRTGRDGCFLVNCTAELAATDPEMRSVVARSFARIESAYRRALERAQTAGTLGAAKRPRALARFFVGIMQSLRIMGKANRDARVLDDIVATALACLD